MTDDWAEIAKLLRTPYDDCHGSDRDAAESKAAELCELMARGELFTREVVDSALSFARVQGIAEGRESIRETLV